MVRRIYPDKEKEQKVVKSIKTGKPVQKDTVEVGGQGFSVAPHLQEDFLKDKGVKKERDVIKLQPKKPDRSIKGQIKRSWALPFGDPRSLKTTLGLGITLAGLATFGLGTTAVAKAAQVGATGAMHKGATGAMVGSGVTQFATNTATKAATMSLLSKLGLGVSAAGLAVTAIGSYPFAGFIQEEAIQTLGFGINSAVRNGDIEGAETATQEVEEILAQKDSILSSIPYANVLSKLGKFFEAARIKNAIDKKVIEDMKTQMETGESEEEKWKRVREEEAEQERATIDYYNQERKAGWFEKRFLYILDQSRFLLMLM